MQPKDCWIIQRYRELAQSRVPGPCPSLTDHRYIPVPVIAHYPVLVDRNRIDRTATVQASKVLQLNAVKHERRLLAGVLVRRPSRTNPNAP